MCRWRDSNSQELSPEDSASASCATPAQLRARELNPAKWLMRPPSVRRSSCPQAVGIGVEPTPSRVTGECTTSCAIPQYGAPGRIRTCAIAFEAQCAVRYTTGARADNEARTRDLHLGKMAHCQLCYIRAVRPRGVEPLNLHRIRVLLRPVELRSPRLHRKDLNLQSSRSERDVLTRLNDSAIVPPDRFELSGAIRRFASKANVVAR